MVMTVFACLMARDYMPNMREVINGTNGNDDNSEIQLGTVKIETA